MMNRYDLIYSDKSLKFLASISKKEAFRIRNKIHEICEDPWHLTSPLVDMGSQRKLRVGDYRVILSINDEKIIVMVIKIGHRKNIYK